MKTESLFSAEYSGARFVNLHEYKPTLGDLLSLAYGTALLGGPFLFICSCVYVAFTL